MDIFMDILLWLGGIERDVMSLSQIVSLVMLYVGSIRDIEEMELPDEERDLKIENLDEKFEDALSPGMHQRVMSIVSGMWEAGYADYFHEEAILNYIHQGG